MRPIWLAGVTSGAADGIRTALTSLRTRVEAQGGTLELVATPNAQTLPLLESTELALHLVLPLSREELLRELPAAAACLDRAVSVRISPGNHQRPHCYADAEAEVVRLSDLHVRPDGTLDGEALEGSAGHKLALELGQLAPEGTPEAFDAVAVGSSDLFRRQNARLIMAHAAAAICGVTAGVIPRSSLWPPNLLFAGLMALEACLVLWIVLKRRSLRTSRVHEKWVQARFAAEVLRGVRAEVAFVDPLRPTIAGIDPEWRCFAVTHARKLGRGAQGWQAAREAYLAGRIHSEESGQLPYFERKAKQAAPGAQRATKAAMMLVRGALLFALMSLTWKSVLLSARLIGGEAVDLAGSAFLNFVFRFFPAALPILAGSFLSLENLLDSTRRSSRYPLIGAALKLAAAQLRATESESGAARIVADIETLLCVELLDWRRAERSSNALRHR